MPTSTPLDPREQPEAAAAAQSPRASHPPAAQSWCFWGRAAFPGRRGRAGPAACGERSALTSLVLPWERRGETERETNSSVHLRVHGSSSRGVPRGAHPKAGPSLLCPSLHSRGTEQSHPTQRLPSAPAPSWENFPCAWKATGACGRQEQLRALYPLYFPPAGHDASRQHLWLPAVSCPC